MEDELKVERKIEVDEGGPKDAGSVDFLGVDRCSVVTAWVLIYTRLDLLLLPRGP